MRKLAQFGETLAYHVDDSSQVLRLRRRRVIRSTTIVKSVRGHEFLLVRKYFTFLERKQLGYGPSPYAKNPLWGPDPIASKPKNDPHDMGYTTSKSIRNRYMKIYETIIKKRYDKILSKASGLNAQ